MTHDSKKPQNGKALIGSLSTYLRHASKISIANPDSHTPCGSCDTCCHSVFDKLGLTPEEQTRFGVEYFDMTETGRCPHMGENGCEIYEQRPLTCRMFDCRFFAACDIARVEVGGIPALPNAQINELAGKWAFKPLTDEDRLAAKTWVNAINQAFTTLAKENTGADIVTVIDRAAQQYPKLLKAIKK